MNIVPLTIEQALEFLGEHKRHYQTDGKAIFAIGISDGALHGAVIVGVTLSGDVGLNHIYSGGASEGYTLLYGAAWRAAKALGYKRMIL